jgi:hypothetical protein
VISTFCADDEPFSIAELSHLPLSWALAQKVQLPDRNGDGIHSQAHQSMKETTLQKQTSER